MQTFLEFYGLPAAEWNEGISIWPTLAEGEQVRDYCFTEFGRYEIDHDGFGGFQPMRGVFDGKLKLVVNLLSDDELYDLDKDPYEMDNLIEDDEYAKERDHLHDVLLDWMNETRDPFRGYYWEQRPWRKDARPATWDYTAMTRQRENAPYEERQLDYSTGLPMLEATRVKNRTREQTRKEAEEVIRRMREEK